MLQKYIYFDLKAYAANIKELLIQYELIENKNYLYSSAVKICLI